MYSDITDRYPNGCADRHFDADAVTNSYAHADPCAYIHPGAYTYPGAYCYPITDSDPYIPDS